MFQTSAFVVLSCVGSIYSFVVQNISQYLFFQKINTHVDPFAFYVQASIMEAVTVIIFLSTFLST